MGESPAEKGEIYQKPAPLLPLTTGGLPVVRVLHGELSEIRWTLSQQVINQWRMHFERIMRSNRFLDRWSLFRLPEEFQRTFRILILVPIGALMICLLRNMVGFPTFGIFMPVLMALAFRNTGLLYGLGIFAGVVFIGYVVRRWINKLRLLLVPRLSVILTLVIIFFTVFALIGNKVGLRELMAVGLLPFVILTMTIERFFVITEEAGAREGTLDRCRKCCSGYHHIRDYPFRTSPTHLLSSILNSYLLWQPFRCFLDVIRDIGFRSSSAFGRFRSSS